ncbi:MAG TPA: DUF4383 domain-containing protein [Thermoleophilaceae bacterium]|nr:DUF4383 domain-containing protein [Thermoleophilaceae bacterium]
MEASRDTAREAGAREGAARTLAQATCIAGGVILIAVGVLGFFFGGTDFGVGNVDGRQFEEFLGFEVNGWHNVVHIATGAFLLLMSPKAATAVTGLIIFGAAYVVVAIWGFVDGDDVIGLIPVNFADNVLHAVLAVGTLLVAAMSGGLAAASRKKGREAT